MAAMAKVVATEENAARNKTDSMARSRTCLIGRWASVLLLLFTVTGLLADQDITALKYLITAMLQKDDEKFTSKLCVWQKNGVPTDTPFFPGRQPPASVCLRAAAGLLLRPPPAAGRDRRQP